MEPVTDLRDIRVMIPRARRTLDGPTATGSAALSSNLSDDQLTGVIADAIAEAIFYTEGAFGKRLEVTARDTNYMAPIAWQTSAPLDDAEQTVVMAQAALNYVFSQMSSQKASETLKEADREWSWSVSASALAERVKSLRDMRDRALEMLRSESFAAEEWINTLQVRDAYTDLLVEPFLSAGGYLPSGQEFDPPLGP